MEIGLIKKEQLLPAIWDGGKTFQYFIYPKGSRYEKKDFYFRISSATIEKVPSDFSRFPGYNRFLMMLDNDLELIRNGQKEIYKTGELFQFDSDDIIQSFSLGNDINLMLKKTSGDVVCGIVDGALRCSTTFAFFFALSENVLSIQGRDYNLMSGDCLVMTNLEKESLTMNCREPLLFGHWN